MKRLIALLILACTTAYADEIITDFKDQSLPVLNEELRKYDERILNLESATAYSPSASNALSGSVIQVQHTQSSSVISCPTAIPYDDSIPQNTEGDEVMTLGITPTNASNILLIRVVAYLSSGTWTYYQAAALFQDSTVNALAAGAGGTYGGIYVGPVVLEYKMTAGTTSATTFKVRCGSLGADCTFNGGSGSRYFGGVMQSSITITEIKA